MTDDRKYEYRRMTARQFQAALDQLDLTPVHFARLTGFNIRRIQRCLAGEEDIPQFAVLICSLLTLPGGLAMAERVCAAMLIDEEPEPRPRLGKRLIEAAGEARAMVRGEED